MEQPEVGRSVTGSKCRAPPGPFSPRKKSLKPLEEEQQIPSPEGAGEDSLNQGKQTNKNCRSGRGQVYILGLDL